LLHNNRLTAVVAGGIFFLLAALLTNRVEDICEVRTSHSAPESELVAKI